MSERSKFLEALAANEDDHTIRIVFADWLDDQGEHEEAERQRKWPAAKAWLVEFFRKNNPSTDGLSDVGGDEDYRPTTMTYEKFMDLARQAVESDELWFSCVDNERLANAFRSQGAKVWSNWSVVTGIPLPEDAVARSRYSCAC